MAKKEILKIAPGISIVSKGIILDAGEKVTAENFANKEVFESLKKSKQVVTEAEFLKLQKELLNPDSDSKKKDDKSGKAGKQSDDSGDDSDDAGSDDSGDDSDDAGSDDSGDDSGDTDSDGQDAGAGA